MVLSSDLATALVSETQDQERSLGEDLFTLAEDEPGNNSRIMSDSFIIVSTRPLPHLPLEVVEQILDYTFIRWSRLTPSSDPFNLNNTTHLLLVSKAFRELCLPLFYRSVTITRPSHYTTFFNPQDGIFVPGEDGKKRWSYVRELSIIIGVEPPFLGVRDLKDDLSTSFLTPLESPSWAEPRETWGTSPFKRLCFLDYPPPPLTTESYDLESTLLLNALKKQPARRRQEEEDLVQQYRENDAIFQAEGQSPMSFEQFMEWTFGEDLDGEIDSRIGVACFATVSKKGIPLLTSFFRSTKPQELNISSSSLDYYHTPFDLFQYPVLYVHRTPNEALKFPPLDASKEGEWLAQTLYTFADEACIRGMQLVGYGEGVILPFARAYRRLWREEERSFDWSCYWENEEGELMVFGDPNLKTTEEEEEEEEGEKEGGEAN